MIIINSYIFYMIQGLGREERERERKKKVVQMKYLKKYIYILKIRGGGRVGILLK